MKLQYLSYYKFIMSRNNKCLRREIIMNAPQIVCEIVPNSEISKYFDRAKIWGDVSDTLNKISVGPREIQRPKTVMKLSNM
jgi:hypothetical protein